MIEALRLEQEEMERRFERLVTRAAQVFSEPSEPVLPVASVRSPTHRSSPMQFFPEVASAAEGATGTVEEAFIEGAVLPYHEDPKAWH